MRKYRLGAHTKFDLIRQIAIEHELQIISGKVARDHIHLFFAYRPDRQPNPEPSLDQLRDGFACPQGKRQLQLIGAPVDDRPGNLGRLPGPQRSTLGPPRCDQ